MIYHIKRAARVAEIIRAQYFVLIQAVIGFMAFGKAFAL
jgi:hypothetical protein